MYIKKTKRVKKYLLIITIVALFVSCENKNNFNINGTFNGYENSKLYLIRLVDGDKIVYDSTNILEGNFAFSGYLDFPEIFYISIEEQKSNIPVFVEPSEMKIEIKIDSAGKIETIISGSYAQKIYDSYNKQMDFFYEIDRNIYENIFKEAKAANDEQNLNYADSLFTINDDAKKEFLISYAFNNNNVASAYIIYKNAYFFDLNSLDSITGNFDKSVHGSTYYNKLTERIKVLKRVDIGEPIIDFTSNDTSGNPVALSSLKGKYLLMDFWASWCGPCRRENPNIVSVYNDYKEKKFDVIGISFDNDEEKWKQAIIDDGLAWTHVSDLKRWDCEAKKLYGVRSIPHSILVDPDGNIIAKNLNGEKLREKISELLDK